MDQNLQNRISKLSNSEMSLQELIRSIWSTRYTVLILVTLFVLGFATFLFNKSLSREDVYVQHIDFTFDGVQEAKYPNGDSFRLEDVLAPSVVNSVFNELDLAQYKVSLQQVSSLLSVFPYAPGRQFIVEKYAPILDDDEATELAKAEARQEMEAVLSKQLSSSASIQFINRDTMFPDAIARKLVEAVAKNWAKQAIEIRGVTKQNISILAPEVIAQSLGGSSDPLRQLRILWTHFNSLKLQLTKLLQYPGVSTVVDAEKKLSAQDLLALMVQTERDFVEAPAGWSKSLQGSLGLNLPLYSPRLFDITLVENLDYLIAIDVLSQRIQLVMGNVNKLSVQLYGGIVTDPETGLALSDLNRLLLDMQQYELQQLRAPLLQLAISRDESKVPLYYNFRIQELKRQEKALAERVVAIRSAESRYVSGGVTVTSPTQEGAVVNNALGRTTTMIPQFGDAFLDKLIAMSEKGGDSSYRQGLNKETIDLENKAIDIKLQIAEIEQYLSIFNEASERKVSDEVFDEYARQIENSFADTFNKLKTYAEVSQRISNRLRLASEIASIFSSSPYSVSDDTYLQNIDSSQIGLKDVQARMVDYAATAHRIVNELNSERVGVVNDLYVLAGMPEKEQLRLLSKKNIIVLMLGIFVMVLFGVLGHLGVRTIRSS